MLIIPNDYFLFILIIYFISYRLILQLLMQNEGKVWKVQRKQKELQRSQTGGLLLTAENLKLICETDGLYQYPELNNKLYLHFKIIQKIQHLDAYVNLKSLYLQNNVIKNIQNIEKLTKLQNLFLQNNMIKCIQNLDKCRELRIINLSNNNIFEIKGLSQLPCLQTLTLSKNYLQQFDSLQHLGHCALSLTSIDISDNKIKGDVSILDLIPQVKCLYLMGNPFVRDVLYYRRTVVCALKSLMYLDQRGVDEEERMLAQSWGSEGETGFKKTKQKILQHRQLRKSERTIEIMKDIDVHRRKKINVFTNNIRDFQTQIQKLRGYSMERQNQNMNYFYQSRIDELKQKIRQNQQYIDGLYRRMGLDPPPPISVEDVQTTDPSARSEQSIEQMQGIVEQSKSQTSQNNDDEKEYNNSKSHQRYEEDKECDLESKSYLTQNNNQSNKMVQSQIYSEYCTKSSLDELD